LVIILPGIEGESNLNRDIRRGLAMAGIDYALPIYHWGRPIPGLGMILNQMDFVGNRLAGVRIAKTIEQYQQEHPGKPVFVVGHSGGGGVAVFAAEGMSEGKQIDGLILLSASIWAGYDLTKALDRCKYGIVNFYNEGDVGLLAIGTTITSNVDGMRGPSAGLNGFDKANRKLYQVNIAHYAYGSDAHTAATQPRFVSAHVAPWITSQTWPVAARFYHRYRPPGRIELAKAFDPPGGP
jgi:pimeloyl-ACP methyl ester carboxylesterase